MLLLAVLTLACLALVNYRISGGALLHPAVVFCSVWAIDLLLTWMVGDFFYPMSPTTILIFIGGACAFSVGSVAAYFFPQNKRTRQVGQLSNRIISVLVIFLLCSLPFAVRWLLNQVAQHESLNFFASAARTLTDESVKGSLGYALFGNLVSLANMVAIVAFCEREDHPRRWRIALTVAFTFDMAIAARSAFIPVFLAILCLDWLKLRRLRWKLLMAATCVLLILASAVAVFLGKADADPNASALDNAVPIAQGIAVYAAGGPVAFDQIVRDPAIQSRFLPISSAFVFILNKLGAQLPEHDPEAGPGFIELGPHHIPTNVYSIYGDLLDLGYPAMMGILMLLGFGITMCFCNALLGKEISAILYASFFSSLALSTFTELFFRNIYYLTKFYALLCFVYLLPEIWLAGKRTLGHLVERDIEAQQAKTA